MEILISVCHQIQKALNFFDLCVEVSKSYVAILFDIQKWYSVFTIQAVKTNVIEREQFKSKRV